jgi:hypothetical protein
MSVDDSRPEALADLLPRWHRLADERAGGPLRELLRVLGEPLDAIRAEVDQQYANWFVETAAEGALPYLGDLVGHRPPVGRAGVEGPASRREIAATVARRRRQGTLAVLEELARVTAGWPARAVETSTLLAHHQPVRLFGAGTGPAPGRGDARRASRGRLSDLREGGALEAVGTPFETLARTVDVRRAASRYRPGGYTPTGVRLYVWRLRPYSVTHAPAFCVDSARNLYTFSVLGVDTPLVTLPIPEPSTTHLATVDNVPAFVRRRQLADRMADYYGPGKSLLIWRDGQDEPVPSSAVVVADLTDWRYQPARGQVAVDPELGRIAFNSRDAPEGGVWTTYHYAFGDDLGGGEYPRTPAGAGPVYRVGPDQPFQQIMDAYRHYRADREAGAGPDGTIEITDTGAYQERLEFDLAAGDRLTVRAADLSRPVLRLLDWSSNRPDALEVRAADRCEPGDEPRITLDGLLVTGRGVHVSGPVGALVLRHCTLVPGWSAESSRDPVRPDEPSLVLDRTTACVRLDRCVLGTIEVIGDEAATDPLAIHLQDCILDATGHDRPALCAPDGGPAHAHLHAHRSTIIGEVRVHAVPIASDSIFTGVLRVARRQVGCLRYCYLPPGSRTPRRYRCQPDLAGGDRAAQLRPLFAGERYGSPGYGWLSDGCAEGIARGAQDGAEMGAFHDVFRPQREDGLRARFAEYTPAGTDAGISFVS